MFVKKNILMVKCFALICKSTIPELQIKKKVTMHLHEQTSKKLSLVCSTYQTVYSVCSWIGLYSVLCAYTLYNTGT